MIVKSVVLRCAPERAFALFTQHAGEWWPADRRHTKDSHSIIRMDATGRFFERATDGTEIDLGVVRLYAPTSKLILDWYPGTSQQQPTQVEVTFDAIDLGTRVTIVHGPGTASADLYARTAPKFDASWDIVLAAFALHQ